MKQHNQTPPGKTFPPKAQTQSQAQAGISLMEVLLMLTLISLTMMPFTLMISGVAQGARGAYVQSSRSILLSSLADEATDERGLYYAAYNMGMQSNITESGQVLPWRVAVDTNVAATDTFQKSIYFYLYNNSSDAANAPRYKTKLVTGSGDTKRYHFAANTFAFTDASGFWWQGHTTYDNANRVPGRNSAGPITMTESTAVANLPGHRDAKIYQDGWYTNSGSSIFSAPVANGLYTVKLYFSEINKIDRLMDIKIEGTLMNPDAPYNAYYHCGNQFYCGNVQMFDVYVNDNVLDIQLDSNTNATWDDPFIRSISIKKRT